MVIGYMVKSVIWSKLTHQIYRIYGRFGYLLNIMWTKPLTRYIISGLECNDKIQKLSTIRYSHLSEPMMYPS